MNRLEHFRSTGLGDITKSQAGGITAGAALAIAAPFTGPAAPFVLAAAALASLVSQAFAGCGSSCIRATTIVNQIEPYLKQNVAGYLALPTPRPLSAQQAGVNFFTTTWQQVLNACSDASLGDAGKRCISDRQSGGKWDWFSYYLDPIANDTNVYDDSVIGQSENILKNTVSDVTNLVGGNILIPIILALGGAFLVFGDRK